MEQSSFLPKEKAPESPQGALNRVIPDMLLGRIMADVEAGWPDGPLEGTPPGNHNFTRLVCKRIVDEYFVFSMGSAERKAQVTLSKFAYLRNGETLDADEQAFIKNFQNRIYSCTRHPMITMNIRRIIRLCRLTLDPFANP